MAADAWSSGARDGDRWLWRRDDVARALVTYTKDGAVESTRPYTAEENRQADARVARAVRSSAAAKWLADAPTLSTLPAAIRLARLESVVAALLGDSDG